MSEQATSTAAAPDSKTLASTSGGSAFVWPTCTKCGLNSKRLALLAMVVDSGAKCYPHPLNCAEGGEHDFA